MKFQFALLLFMLAVLATVPTVVSANNKNVGNPRRQQMLGDEEIAARRAAITERLENIQIRKERAEAAATRMVDVDHDTTNNNNNKSKGWPKVPITDPVEHKKKMEEKLRVFKAMKEGKYTLLTDMYKNSGGNNDEEGSQPNE